MDSAKKEFLFDCYYNEEEPIITVENPEIAEVLHLGKNGIAIPKKPGKMLVKVHFDETEKTVHILYFQKGSSRKESIFKPFCNT